MPDPAYTGNKGEAVIQTGATFAVSITNTTGNQLVAFQTTALGGGSSPATPTGWTAAAGSPITISASHELAVWYRTADGSASYTFNNASGGLPTSSVTVQEFSNALATPEQFVSATGSSGTADTGSVTPADARDIIVTCWAIGINLSGSIAPHASYSAIYTSQGNSTALQSTAYKSPGTTSPVGNNTATLDSSEAWGAFMVVLAPSAAADKPQGWAAVHPAVMWEPRLIPMPG